MPLLSGALVKTVSVEIPNSGDDTTITGPFIGFQPQNQIDNLQNQINLISGSTGSYVTIRESRDFILTNNFGLSGNINLTGKILNGGAQIDSPTFSSFPSIEFNNIYLLKINNTKTTNQYFNLNEIDFDANGSISGAGTLVGSYNLINLRCSGTGAGTIVPMALVNTLQSGSIVNNDLYSIYLNNTLINSSAKRLYGLFSQNGLAGANTVVGEVYGGFIQNRLGAGVTITGNVYGLLIDGGGNSANVSGAHIGLLLNLPRNASTGIVISGSSNYQGKYLEIIKNQNKILAIDSGGSLGMGTDNPMGKLDVRGFTYTSGIIITGSRIPTGSSSPGNSGEIAFQSGFYYIAIRDNYWQRTVLTDF